MPGTAGHNARDLMVSPSPSRHADAQQRDSVPVQHLGTSIGVLEVRSASINHEIAWSQKRNQGIDQAVYLRPGWQQNHHCARHAQQADEFCEAVGSCDASPVDPYLQRPEHHLIGIVSSDRIFMVRDVERESSAQPAESCDSYVAYCFVHTEFSLPARE